MSESESESRTAALGRKRKRAGESDVFGAPAAAAAEDEQSSSTKARRLSESSKETGEISSRVGSRRPSNAFSSYEEFQQTRGQGRPKVSISLRDAISRPFLPSFDLSNTVQANPLESDSGSESGEISESDSSGSDSDDDSDDESDSSGPTHARASASPSPDHHNTSTQASNPIADEQQYEDGMVRLHQLSEEDQDLQYHYFHLTKDEDLIYCMCCGDRGHQDTTCPSRTCSHCGAQNQHGGDACPRYRRCTRCRQRGHDVTDCKNSLPIITWTDRCDICGEPGHVEEECAKLWSTSLKPPLKKINKKEERDMFKACYNCGESGYDAHWGDDCPDRYYDERTSGPNVVKTWSRKDASKYIYEASNEAEGEFEEEKEGSESAAARNWQVGLFDS